MSGLAATLHPRHDYLCVIAAQQAVGVFHRLSGDIGVRAIYKHLHFSRPPGFKITAIAGRNDERHSNLFTVHHGLNRRDVLHMIK